MEKDKIEKSLQYAFRINRNYNNFEIRTLNNYIKKVADYIIKNYADANPSEIVTKILLELQEFNNTYCSIANLRGKYLQLNAIKRVIANPKLLLQIVKEERKSTKIQEESCYTNEFKHNDMEAAKEIIRAIMQEDKNRKRMIEMQRSQGKIKQPNNKMTYYSDLPDEKFTTEVMRIAKEIIPNLEKMTKGELKKNLKLIFSFFDEFNLAETYMKKQKIKMQYTSLGELIKYLPQAQNEEKPITFASVFSEDILDKLEINDLIMLNLFYHNRLSKEITMIGEALLAIYNTEMTEEILQNKEDPRKIQEVINKKCSGKTMQALKNKANWLNTMISILLKDSEKNDTEEEEKKQGYAVINVKEDLDKIVELGEERYGAIFGEMDPNLTHSLKNDLKIWKIIRNISDNIYKIKDHLLSIATCEQVHSQTKGALRNFGVIAERNPNPRKVLIGIDVEGISMPIKIHARTDELAEMLTINEENTILPEYEGAEDFWVNNNLLSTSILFPMTREYERAIRDLLEKSEGKEEEKLLEHLRFLSNRHKFPKHLMEKITDKKGKVMFYRKPRSYIDILTGKKYHLNQRGELEPNISENDTDDTFGDK